MAAVGPEKSEVQAMGLKIAELAGEWTVKLDALVEELSGLGIEASVEYLPGVPDPLSVTIQIVVTVPIPASLLPKAPAPDPVPGF